jgi:hypothetical protein
MRRLWPSSSGDYPWQPHGHHHKLCPEIDWSFVEEFWSKNDDVTCQWHLLLTADPLPDNLGCILLAMPEQLSAMN